MSMEALVRHVIVPLVDFPDQVTIQSVQSNETLVLKVQVANADVGKVIGKDGRIANAIRTLVRSAASREGVRVSVEIVNLPRT